MTFQANVSADAVEEKPYLSLGADLSKNQKSKVLELLDVDEKALDQYNIVALVMGLGTTVAFAENLTSGVETVMAVNDFTPIEVKDLPAAVTEAIAKNFAESTVKEAAVEAAEDGSKTYQVVLTDKEGAESTVFFNEKGEILK